jgi:hypothetical protein
VDPREVLVGEDRDGGLGEVHDLLGGVAGGDRLELPEGVLDFLEPALDRILPEDEVGRAAGRLLGGLTRRHAGQGRLLYLALRSQDGL